MQKLTTPIQLAAASWKKASENLAAYISDWDKLMKYHKTM